MNYRNDIRNVAIIAHVDHGKTTLVDELLKQSDTLDAHTQLQERAMDSNALEKERGITILAKNTAVDYKNYRINIMECLFWKGYLEAKKRVWDKTKNQFCYRLSNKRREQKQLLLK